jgi:site-specific DNA-methyltransferase (adenine-specific)
VVSTATPEDVLAGRARWCVVEGDALALLASLPDACLDAVVTDPPYASTGDAASVMSRDGVMAVPREVQFYEAWAREHLRAWVRAMKPTGAAWFTCDWRGAMVFDLAAHKIGHRSPVVGVWDRGGMGMGHILRKTWEAFVVIPMPRFERKRADVADLWRVEWSAARRECSHAAQKPVQLYERAIRLVTDDGADALVCDPFAGSGTTGEAALRLGRRVILLERDADYAEIARRRCEAAEQGTDWRAPAEQLSLLGGAA